MKNHKRRILFSLCSLLCGVTMMAHATIPEGTAGGTNAVAIGKDSKANGTNAVAVGIEAEATASDSLAVGNKNSSTGTKSLTLGYSNLAAGVGSSAIGYYNNNYDSTTNSGTPVSVGKYSAALGSLNQSIGDYSSAVGRLNRTEKAYDVAMGFQNTASGTKSSAFGYKNVALGEASSAVGYFNKANAKYTTSVGTMNTVNGERATAFGYNNTADGKKSHLYGYWNYASGYGSIAFGTQNNRDFETYYHFDGTEKTGPFGMAYGIGNVTIGVSGLSVGHGNYAIGDESAALGWSSFATGKGTIAIGRKAFVGDEAFVNANGVPIASPVKHAIAMGNYSTTKVDHSVALGSYSSVTAASGTYGYNPKTDATMAVGDLVTTAGTTEAEYNAAFEKEVSARKAYEDASAAAEAKLLEAQTEQWTTEEEFHALTAEYETLNAEAMKKGEEWELASKELGDLNGSWRSTAGAISVGNEELGITRQITGVAAGTNLTDAVNVAQLKAWMPTFYSGGTSGDAYVQGNKIEGLTSLGALQIDFGDGLKAEKKGENQVFVSLDKEFINNNPDLKGEKGDKGDDGKSAYDTWKEKHGNENKTENDFIDSLKGEKGDKGEQGPQGEQGPVGEMGPAGEPGSGQTPHWDEYLEGTNIDMRFVGLDKYSTRYEISLQDIVTLTKRGSITVGDTTITTEGISVKDGPSLTVEGVDAGGKKITNVAAGVAPTDAVNVSQLKGLVSQNMDFQMNQLRDESRDGDALGAAMAALQPIAYDPYEPNQIMAGAGYYRGSNAVALGIGHYKNESTFLHAGLAYAGNSHLMLNAGVTWRYGDGDKKASLPERYKAGPVSSVYVLQDEVMILQAENREQKKEIEELKAMVRQLLDR